MAKAAKGLSRAAATGKAPLPIIPVSPRARAVLAGHNELFQRRLARNRMLSEDTPAARRAAIQAENKRDAAEQTAREDKFLASVWPKGVTRAERQWKSPKPVKSLDDLGNLAVAAYFNLSARSHLVPALLSLSTAADVLEKVK
jgi:hypothetical protein